MSENKISSLEKIGYTKKIPEKADINDYESIKEAIMKIKNLA